MAYICPFPLIKFNHLSLSHTPTIVCFSFFSLKYLFGVSLYFLSPFFLLPFHRGCTAQYAGVLDSPWSNVVDAMDNLVTTYIRSDVGIVAVIKQLDTKLSETIMRAMENGPKLEDMVSSREVKIVLVKSKLQRN